MCLHACFHTRIALHLLRLASIVRDLLTLLDNHLVAATSECNALDILDQAEPICGELL